MTDSSKNAPKMGRVGERLKNVVKKFRAFSSLSSFHLKMQKGPVFHETCLTAQWNVPHRSIRRVSSAHEARLIEPRNVLSFSSENLYLTN